MMFLRDEMVPSDLASWRYRILDEEINPDWYFNIGDTADEISLLLFGA